MTTYTVTSDFPVGTTGNVVFRRKEWLSSATEGIIPPAEVTAVITSHAISQALRPTTETGVSPSFQYEVDLNIDGQVQMRGFMELTENSELADIFNWTTPPNPDVFVTRQEFEELLEIQGGTPVSKEYVDAADASEATARAAADTTNANAITAEATSRASGDSTNATAITAEATARAAADTTNANAVTAEATARAAADTALDGRLDTLEAVPAWVVNTDADPGTTIYIGTVEPTDPPYDLEVGDVWIDTTPVP